ncbi:AAA family ATPase [Phormidesmis sp. 146-33]
MLQSGKVQSSEQGKQNLKQAIKEAGFTQEQLAQKTGVSIDTIKRLIGTKSCSNGVERHLVSRVAEFLKFQPIEIVSPRDWYCQQCLPEEFESLIVEKTRWFCGRHFVFEAFQRFLKQFPKGYFTIVGEAGMGKSAIAAKYVADYHTICYFNIMAERRNRPELFLESIRQQLIQRYQLQNVEKANLATLLEIVSQKLTKAEQLVIVVDALDEVDQDPAENLLHLPTTLPNRVYFLLTRRSYNLEHKQLSVSPGVPVGELDLTSPDYAQFNQTDIKDFILRMLQDPIHQIALKTWIQDRHLSQSEFIEQVAVKSENNFMYLRYVLPAIAEGLYDDLALKQLPQGLHEYYQTHWVRMRMESVDQAQKVIILFTLVEVGTPITCEMVAGMVSKEPYDVQKILDEWFEYLRRCTIEGELCHSIYHASFLEFLKSKRTLEPTRKIFRDVNQQIVNYHLAQEVMWNESTN